MSRILLTRANGFIGQIVIGSLLKRMAPSNITAIVRDRKDVLSLIMRGKGINVRGCQVEDYDSLKTAFEGVETLLLITPRALQLNYEETSNALKAASDNGVSRILYTSLLNCNVSSKFVSSQWHGKLEQYVVGMGVPYTIFRNGLYSDNVENLKDGIPEGKWKFPCGHSRINMVSKADAGEAMANVLLNPDEHINMIYEITGPRTYGFDEITKIVAKVTNGYAFYKPLSPEKYREELAQYGQAEWMINLMSSLAESIREGEMDMVDPALEQLLGRPPKTMEESLPLVIGKN